MAAWPEAHTVFHRDAQYIIQQNANDDWDYETGAEAGYDLNGFEDLEPTPANGLNLATNFGEPTIPAHTKAIKMETQQPDGVSTPGQDKAVSLKGKLLAERSTSSPRATDSAPKQEASKHKTQSKLTRQDSSPNATTIMKATAASAKENNEQTVVPIISSQVTAGPAQLEASNVSSKISVLADATSELPGDNSIKHSNGQKNTQMQSILVSPTTTSTVSNTPVEKVSKVKKTKKEKTMLASDGTSKLKRTKTTESQPESFNQQQDKLLKDIEELSSKQAALTAPTLVAHRAAFKIPPEVAGIPDIADWLEITGYYNLENRQRMLKLYRRKREIQKELAALDSELSLSTASLGLNAPPTTPGPARPAEPILPPPVSSTKRARSPDANAGDSKDRPEKSRRVSSAQATRADIKKTDGHESTPRGRLRTRSPIARSSTVVPSGYDRRTSIDPGRHMTRGRDRDRLSRSPVRSAWPTYHQQYEKRREPKIGYSKTWINPATNTSRTISGSGSSVYPSHPRST